MGVPQARSPRDQSKTAGGYRAGNYVAPIDTVGVDKEVLRPPEKSYAGLTNPFKDIANAFGAVTAGLTRRFNSTGSTRSPSTVVDRAHPKAAADTVTAAQKEATARRYVDSK
jgi:hypothetical protein